MTTCETCNDTHSMSLRGSLVPCTRCPTPCQECRINGRGAYCAKTPCACACHAIVDRPAPAPTPAPGLDLDAVEAAERVMTPGPWRHGSVERHHVFCSEGDRSLLCPEAGRVLLRMNEHFPHDSDAAGIVALRNSAPALIAEVRSLRAAIAEAKRLGREACEYYADAPDLHDPACASLDQRGACDCTAGIAAALGAL